MFIIFLSFTGALQNPGQRAPRDQTRALRPTGIHGPLEVNREETETLVANRYTHFEFTALMPLGVCTNNSKPNQ